MSALRDMLLSAGTIEPIEDDPQVALALSMEQGWGDGLPVIPPTPERVEKMLAYCPWPWDEPIAHIPPRHGAATPIRLAANAVIAGCRPEYFPLYMLAIRAMCEEEFNLYGIQTTTHPAAPVVIVNGPIARELDINDGHNAFGPGWQANATIGRAIRLALLNIGGAIPGKTDMATTGQPGKYGIVVAENERNSPWEPLHVDRGFARETTTVTIVGSEGPHNINDHYSTTADGILQMVAGTVANIGANNLYYAGEPIIVLGPEHARTVASSGWSKDDAKRFLWEHATVSLGQFSPDNIIGRFRQKIPSVYADAPLSTRIPLARCPEDYLLIVLGGVGKHSMYLPSFGDTRSITRALIDPNGDPVTAIEQLRCR